MLMIVFLRIHKILIYDDDDDNLSSLFMLFYFTSYLLCEANFNPFFGSIAQYKFTLEIQHVGFSLLDAPFTPSMH